MEDRPVAFSRRRFIALGAGAALLASAAPVGYAVAVEPHRLRLDMRDVRLPGLPRSLDGLRVGFVTDTHYGPLTDGPSIYQAMEMLRPAKPDLLLLGGDFIATEAHELRPCLDILSNMRPALGTFAVLGNHDRWCASEQELLRGFAATTIRLLVNEAVNLGGLYVAGLDSAWSGKPNARQTLAGVPADRPVLLLMHEPDPVDRLSYLPHSMLCVSGHTHGGQIVAPIAGPLYLPHLGKRYVAGLLSTHSRPDRQIYVSRGVGTTVLPIRFHCRPEVALLTLRHQPQA